MSIFNNLCEKAKADTNAQLKAGGGGGEGAFIYNRNGRFHTRDGLFARDGLFVWKFASDRYNTSQFENGLVLICNEQSAWLYLSLLTDSLKMDYPFQETPCAAAPSPQKKIGEGVSAGERGQPYTG